MRNLRKMYRVNGLVNYGGTNYDDGTPVVF